MAAGKSTTGPRLAHHLGRRFVDLDDVIVRETGQDIPTIFAESGEAEFRRIESQVLRATLQEASDVVLATGGGIVEDPDNRSLLHRQTWAVWLDVRFETVRARLDRLGIAHRPLVRALGWDGLKPRYDRRRRFYAATAHFRFDTDHWTPATVARQVSAALTGFDEHHAA